MAGTNRPSPQVQTPFQNAILKKGSSSSGPKNTSGTGSDNRGTK